MPEVGYKKRKAKWTRDDMIAAARAYEEKHKRIPTASDFNPSDLSSAAARSAERASRWMRRRRQFEEGEYPWTATVWRTFGSWNAFITACGFEPRPANSQLRVERIDSPYEAATRIYGMIGRLTKLDDPLSDEERIATFAEIAEIASQQVEVADLA